MPKPAAASTPKSGSPATPHQEPSREGPANKAMASDMDPCMEYAAPGRSPPGKSLLSEGSTGSERSLLRLPCMRWILACKSSRSEAGEAEVRREGIIQFSNIYSNESIGATLPQLASFTFATSR
ncbi:hypothetical protein GCM10023063_13080 [Arthrobacter methylotrophus]